MQVRAVGGRGAGGSQGAEVEGEVSVTPARPSTSRSPATDSSAKAASTAVAKAASEAQGGGGGSDIRLAPRSAGLSPDTRLIVAGGGAGGGSSGPLGGAAGEEGQGEGRAEPGMPGTASWRRPRWRSVGMRGGPQPRRTGNGSRERHARQRRSRRGLRVAEPRRRRWWWRWRRLLRWRWRRPVLRPGTAVAAVVTPWARAAAAGPRWPRPAGRLRLPRP